MAHVVIGVHGLRNKPNETLLKKWWLQSIHEGFELHGYPRRKFKFELVYWADLLYPNPLELSITDPENELYIEFPYVRSAQKKIKKSNKIRKKLLDLLEKQTDKIFLNPNGTLNLESITEKIIHRFFRDLEIYFTHNCVGKKYGCRRAKDVILDRVERRIKRYKSRKILLIGHSLGSVIAYDALTYRVPDINVDTLVTVGSPLGLPPIMKKLLIEQNMHNDEPHTPVTPENIVRKWYNISDLKDKIALNYSLSDDYKANSTGVKPIDKIVYNDYEFEGRKNSHKSFGYLRTPEMAEIIDEFLSEGGVVSARIQKICNWIRKKFSAKKIRK